MSIQKNIFQHFCSISPNCPANYTWVPEMGRTCLRIGESPGTVNSRIDYFSGSLSYGVEKPNYKIHKNKSP